MSPWIVLLFAVATCVPRFDAAAVDKTLEPRFIGEPVVDACQIKLETSAIFTYDGNGFLKRMAYFASNFGSKIDFNVPSDYGGIWQLHMSIYLLTFGKNHLSQFYDGILSYFGIIWTQPSVPFVSLETPLHCALAVSLYLQHLRYENKSIPTSIKGQGDFFSEHFGMNDSDTAEQFFLEISQWENRTTCKGRMDLLVVLDESGSIGPDNFQTCLKAVALLFGTYDLKSVREGLITFSSLTSLVFPIDNKLTAEEIQTAVRSHQYDGGGTHTNDAIIGAVNLYKATKPRKGVPRVIALFTDGVSVDGVSNIRFAKEAKLVTFAIGIGGYRLSELYEIAYGIKSHVFLLESFDFLLEFYHRLNTETCRIAQTPELCEIVTDIVEKGEWRYFNFPLPMEGLTITWGVQKGGNIEGFYSYAFEYPSDVLHDGALNFKKKNQFFPFVASVNVNASQADTKLFIGIRGLKKKNHYQFMATRGTVKGGSFRGSIGAATVFFILLLQFAVSSRPF